MDRTSGPKPCETCGAALPAGARFCPSCGARLVEHEALRREEGGEHRQITVMFCDLVGSTELSERLDPEDLRDLLRDYQRVCADAIERRDGMIAHYLGDGIMAYFGYPRAREDAAAAAVDAGLEIVRAVAKSRAASAGPALATRVAVHTGRVLVGEMGAGETREHHSVTGLVPNIAARLEKIAPPNGVVVSAQTRSLLGSAFVLQSLGPQRLKGVAEPLEVFRAQGRERVESVLPASAGGLIGRSAELAELDRAWVGAARGESPRVILCAEPGAGKTTLASAFVAQSGIDARHRVEIAGSHASRSIPYAGLIGALELWLRHDAAPDAPEEPVSRIRSWFGTDDTAGDRHAGVLFGLLRQGDQVEADLRRQVSAAWAALLRNRAKPQLIVVEDAHWLDPSTMELVDEIAEATLPGCMRLLLSRLEPSDLADLPGDVRMQLDALPREACVELIEATVGSEVEAGLAQRIIDATNGLPLYVEEFTRSLIDSGRIRRRHGIYRLEDVGAPLETPSSLIDLITARLDRLGGAKLLAQICAVLGPVFDYSALLSVSGMSPDRVDDSVSALAAAGILATVDGGQLRFKHALFQTAAYESLVRRAREMWHRRYLAWLEATPERAERARPEVLGHHLEASARYAEAAEKYLEAGLSANRASASREAAAHFSKCAVLLDRTAVGNARSELRLRAQVLLAGALLSARGPGSPETRAAYERALDLAEHMPETEWHFPAYWGWWRVSDSFATMAHRAQRLLTASERMEGGEFKLQAQHCVWANAFQQGALAQTLASAERGLALYEAGGFEGLGTLYGGHDCKVCALGEIALASWLRGAGDKAVAPVEASLRHAERLEHLGSLMHALDIATMLHHYRRDSKAVGDAAGRLLVLATEHDLEEYRAKARIFLGWAEVTAGAAQDGLRAIDAGLAVLREVGTPEDFPVYQCMRAQALQRLGDRDGALETLSAGREIIASEGVNYWGAEIARSEAETGILLGAPDPDFVPARLREAAAVAAGQGALMLELRAALTGLRWAGGQEDGARAALADILARFAPDARGRDLDNARQALAEVVEP